MCRVTTSWDVSDKVQSWIISTYWTQNTLLYSNVKPFKSAIWLSFSHILFVHLVCVCHVTLTINKVSLHELSCVSLATQPGGWHAKKGWCCSDTMRMSVCRYDMKKADMHSWLCLAVVHIPKGGVTLVALRCVSLSSSFITWRRWVHYRYDKYATWSLRNIVAEGGAISGRIFKVKTIVM